MKGAHQWEQEQEQEQERQEDMLHDEAAADSTGVAADVGQGTAGAGNILVAADSSPREVAVLRGWEAEGMGKGMQEQGQMWVRVVVAAGTKGAAVAGMWPAAVIAAGMQALHCYRMAGTEKHLEGAECAGE